MLCSSLTRGLTSAPLVPFPSRTRYNSLSLAPLNQALDVTLREPEMEISTKQDGAKQFDDEGMAAALAQEADMEGPGGVTASERNKSAKLEPKVCIAVSPGHSTEAKTMSLKYYYC